MEAKAIETSTAYEQKASEIDAIVGDKELSIPNNFDHLVFSGLMEGTFSGPFEMDFEGNHTVVVGSNGTLAVYRATRTTPVCFISRDAEVKVSSNSPDCDLELTAETPDKELSITVQALSGIAGVPVDGKWLDLEKAVLEAAYDLSGTLGKRSIAAILAGSNHPSTFNGGIKGLRLYGRFRRCSIAEIVRKIDEMIEEDLLSYNKFESFPTVGIAPEGAKRMVELRNDLGVVDLAFGDPDMGDAKIFEDLVSWRDSKSSEEHVPRYLVLRRDTIKNISRNVPKNLEELENVVGVGPTTMEKYGEEILSVLSGEEGASPSPSR